MFLILGPEVSFTVWKAKFIGSAVDDGVGLEVSMGRRGRGGPFEGIGFPWVYCGSFFTFSEAPYEIEDPEELADDEDPKTDSGDNAD